MNSDKKIKRCFRELLKIKSFDRITVTEICELSDVSRRTFYNHFDDLYALLYRVLNDGAEDLKSRKVVASLKGPGKDKTWEPALEIGILYFREMKDVISNIYGSEEWELIKSHLIKTISSHLSIAVKSASERAGVTLDPEDEEFLSGFYTSVFMMVVERDIVGGMQDDPKWIVDYIKTLLDPSFDNAVMALAGRKK